MKVTRVLAFLVVVMAGFVVEAQCLKCYRTPPSFTQGTCGESFDGYCDRQCCGTFVGNSCTIPDFIDDCDPWLTGGGNARASLVREAVGVHTPDGRMFFTSRQPFETRRASFHRRLQKLDPAAPKCTART